MALGVGTDVVLNPTAVEFFIQFIAFPLNGLNNTVPFSLSGRNNQSEARFETPAVQCPPYHPPRG